MRVFTPRAALACYLMLMLAYLTGAIIPPLDGASAEYADVAIGIYEEGNWVQFMTQDQVYRGGPPLLFWLAALSFEIFGVSVVAYKLPSLLFSALAVYSTVRLGALLYNETVGRLAGVILASAFAFLFSSADASMDILLVGSVAFTTNQLFIFATDANRLSARAHLVVAGAGLALGLAASGLAGVVLPLLAVFMYLIYRLEWRRIFDPFWLVLPLSVLLFASPLLYAYYTQFGMDQLMKFVMWLQSAEQQAAGSLPAGEGKDLFSDFTDLFFYYYTYLWAFLPWSAIALWALASGMLRLMNDRYWPRAQGYAVTLGVIAFVFILLSLARFNLLCYVSALLPFFAILLAGWLPARLRHPGCLHWLWRVQYVVFVVVVDAALVLNGFMFRLDDWIIGVAAVALLALGIWGIPRWVGGSKLVIVSVSVSAVFWLLTNINVYPKLLKYQAGTVLGNALMDQPAKAESIHYLEGGGWAASFNVAIRQRAKPITLAALRNQKKPTVLFVSAVGWEMIKGEVMLDLLRQDEMYDVAHPGWKFLNPGTREKELRPAYLLQVRPQESAADVQQH